jgi:hypothetical protein
VLAPGSSPSLTTNKIKELNGKARARMSEPCALYVLPLIGQCQPGH